MELQRNIRYTYRYDQVLDSFTLEHQANDEDWEQELPEDFACLTLNKPGEFILFDNNEPGRIEAITHDGKSKRTIRLLANTALTAIYPLVCKAFRKGTQLYGELERTRTLVVPETNARYLARVALHAGATDASDKVLDFYKSIAHQLTPSGGDAGEVPLPSV